MYQFLLPRLNILALSDNARREESPDPALPSWWICANPMTDVLETLQRRVMKIVNYNDRRSELGCQRELYDTLRARRQVLTERFFTRNVLKSYSCLHYLLPEMRDRDITDKLRNAKTVELLPARTERFRKSFIPHCIANYQ